LASKTKRGIFLNNKKEPSNYKRYDFNIENPNGVHERSKFSGWWFAIIVLVIALLIGMGVSFLQNPKKNAQDKIKNDPITKSVKGKLSTEIQDQQVAKFQDRLNQEDDNGITATQREKLQTVINDTDNQSVKKREQNILNNAQTKPTAMPQKQPKAPKDKPHSDDETFSTEHTFSSIDDAKDWANATKNQWLADGYTNYKITTNGQGYYNLEFVK